MPSWPDASRSWPVALRGRCTRRRAAPSKAWSAGEIAAHHSPRRPDAGRSTTDTLTRPADDPDNVGELIERLNTGWRIAGPDAARASFKQRLVMPLRAAITRLLRTQETFNSLVVQYVNHQHHTISEEHQAMMAELDRYREALQARERRMDHAMQALLAENTELRTAIGVVQAQLRSGRSDRSGRSGRSDRSDRSDRSEQTETQPT